MVTAGWSASVRLFEAAACAVPIISDRWDGLGDLFPENAVVVADTAEEVLAALDLPEPRRRTIGRAAQEIVFAEHRAEVRARQLADHLQVAHRNPRRSERVA